MPQPVFAGSFPVIISEDTRQSEDGSYIFVKTSVTNLANLATPELGKLLNTGGRKLSLTNLRIENSESLFTITETYTGADTSSPELYEIVASVQEEPIASHPAFTAPTGDFSSSIVSAGGGIATEGVSGGGQVLFNKDGSFLFFKRDSENNFFGVKSFLSPRITYKRTYSSETIPTAGEKIGYIFGTPYGSPPVIEAGRDWLLTSVAWQTNGNSTNESGQIQVTEEYLSSGPSGWNKAIYEVA